MTDPKIIVALDTFNPDEANLILDQLDSNLCKIKIGSIVFNALGKSFLQSVAERGFKIFLDLKLHDIPNTVKETILGFSGCSIDMLTVHLSGGEKMLDKALLAAKRIDAKLIGVSLLTSLEESDSTDLFDSNIKNQIIRLFMVAKKINIDGIVCSPLELDIANSVLGSNVLKITPGIRETSLKDDQARTMGARDAIKKGASFLVIGRPITQAENIALALQNFSSLINE
jgi:orotidine-5'-phosphate decarboxylase